MSESDRPSKGSWSGRERRHAERRSGRDRRTQVSFRPKEEERRVAERRSGTDRRSDSDWQSVPLEVTLAADFDPVEGLVAAATQARSRAQAHYSGFQVGAALETSEGQIVTGCNVENATYGLTLCAERVALVKALSEGHHVFTRIVVVADTENLTPPCGPCRQLLWEYCGDIEIVLANLERATARYRLASLLPLPFDRRLLQ